MFGRSTHRIYGVDWDGRYPLSHSFLGLLALIQIPLVSHCAWLLAHLYRHA